MTIGVTSSPAAFIARDGEGVITMTSARLGGSDCANRLPAAARTAVLSRSAELGPVSPLTVDGVSSDARPSSTTTMNAAGRTGVPPHNFNLGTPSNSSSLVAAGGACVDVSLTQTYTRFAWRV